MSFIPNKNPGLIKIRKFGLNNAVNTTKEDIWDGGGVYEFPPDEGVACEVVSTLAADSLAGTGAQKVIVQGLDENFEEKQVEVEMTGLTAVDIGIFSRVYRAYVTVSGTGGANAGVITVRNSAATTKVYAQIAVGNNQTLMAIYTVPANTIGYLYSLTGCILRETSNNKAADVTLYYRNFGSNSRRLQSHVAVHGNNPTNTMHYNHCPDTLPEKTDIICCGTATSESPITAEFELLMVQQRT